MLCELGELIGPDMTLPPFALVDSSCVGGGLVGVELLRSLSGCENEDEGLTSLRWTDFDTIKESPLRGIF